MKGRDKAGSGARSKTAGRTGARPARRGVESGTAGARPAVAWVHDPLRLSTLALREALQPDRPADLALRAFFAEHRELGRRERGVIAETVYDVLRNRRLFSHLAESGPGPQERRLVLLSMGRKDASLPRHDRLALDDDLRRWLERALAIDVATLPPAVQVSMPDWLYETLVRAYGDDDARRLCTSLLHPAPLDLRANLLKGDRDAALAALAAAGLSARALDIAPAAIRLEGKPGLEHTAPFAEGLIEVQDAGSQLLALLAAPRRGQTVVDFCAGAGGKTLALAAAMRSSGQIYACDVSAARLARLKPRLKRSTATNVQPFGIDSEHDPKLARLAGRADVVLVDAPCSGTGTLRRNPELKWRQKPDTIGRLVATQRSVLDAAARLVKVGGALVYGTCSLLPEENDEIRAWFEATHPGWRVDPAGEVLARQGARIDPALPAEVLRLRPDLHGTDAFYAVRWVREPRTEQDR